MRPKDLDEEQCLVHLREKGETSRRQPVSPTLMWHLLQHVEHRGAPLNGRLLRCADGRPITYHRYDNLTWVERHFGYAVARAFAGHNDTNSDAGSTMTYVRAILEEVTTALAALTSEHHPLAV